MRFLLGFVSGIVALVALNHSANRPRRRVRAQMRNRVGAQPVVSRNLARYYHVSLN